MRGPAFTALRLPEDFRPPGPAGQAEVPTRALDWSSSTVVDLTVDRRGLGPAEGFEGLRACAFRHASAGLALARLPGPVAASSRTLEDGGDLPLAAVRSERIRQLLARVDPQLLVAAREVLDAALNTTKSSTVSVVCETLGNTTPELHKVTASEGQLQAIQATSNS